MPIGDQDKSWAPHFCCGSCRSTLEGWLRGCRKCMPFAISRIWRDPYNHHDDCNFCIHFMVKKVGDRMNISYPSIPSSIAPVSHYELFILSPPCFDQQSEEQPSVWDMNDDPDYKTSQVNHRISLNRRK